MADEKSTSPVYAILDVETSGLSRKQDRIVQIACLKIGQDASRKTWMRYINPEMDSKYLRQAFLIHRIPPDFLKDKPLFKDVAESFCEFLKDVDYLVAHNCMFDWDMLCREFEIIDQSKKDESSEDISKLWWERFHCKKIWVDTLRLAMVCFPQRENYRLGAIKEFLKIEPQQGMAGEDLSQCDHGGDDWKMHQHDAMYDVFTTYGVLRHCIKSTFADLLKNYPMVLLDTPLLADMQKLIDQKRTRTQDLLPFAQRSKEYFTTSRPRGKKLGNLSKNYLQMMTFYSKADERSDDRVILIYEAAILEPVENDIVPHSSLLKKENEDKEEKVDSKQEEEEEKEKVENEKKKKEDQEKRNGSELLSHSSASMNKDLEKKERINDKMEEFNENVQIGKEVGEEEEKRNELLSHSSASMQENAQNHEMWENKVEKDRSEAQIGKETEEEQEKSENAKTEQKMEDTGNMEIKGEIETVKGMKGEQEKSGNEETEARMGDNMEEINGETEIIKEMNEEEEKGEKERMGDKMEESKDEAKIVKEEKEKSENAETEERMEDEMEDTQGEAEIVKEMKDEKENSENTKTEERKEDKMGDIKDEAEINNEMKEEQDKMDSDGDVEEKFYCSSLKKPKLSLQ